MMSQTPQVEKAEPTPAPAWLSDKDLAARYQVSRMTIWRWSKAHALPKPYRLGENTTRWRATEIEAHDAAVVGGVE